MVPKYLPVIDSRCALWKAQVDRQMDLGSNFLFILSHNAPGSLYNTICTNGSAPESLDHVDLLPLTRYLHPGALQVIKSALAGGALVNFVKQLQFPPRAEWNPNGYLLYCEMRGIIAHHDDFVQARLACQSEYQELLLQGEYPEVAVFQWSTQTGAGRWLRVYAPLAEAWSAGESSAFQLPFAAVA